MCAWRQSFCYFVLFFVCFFCFPLSVTIHCFWIKICLLQMFACLGVHWLWLAHTHVSVRQYLHTCNKVLCSGVSEFSMDFVFSSCNYVEAPSVAFSIQTRMGMDRRGDGEQIERWRGTGNLPLFRCHRCARKTHGNVILHQAPAPSCNFGA